MDEENYNFEYDNYMRQLQPLNLNLFSEDLIKLFKKNKGKGQFILQMETDEVLLKKDGNFINLKKEEISIISMIIQLYIVFLYLWIGNIIL